MVVNCRNCGVSELSVLWHLKDAPYGDLFRSEKNLALETQKSIFRVASCNNCELLQLADLTNIEYQYDNYLYKTSITVGLNSYYAMVAESLFNSYLQPSSRVLDIGSNDGSFLTHFKSKGMEVLGIEPSSLAGKEAANLGIPTIRNYFSSELAKQLIEERHYVADLITINYTLANVSNVLDVLNGIESILSDEGVVSIITGYHPDQFAVNMFDYIGHDHLVYFSLSTLIKCCENANLKVIDAIRSENKGGSIQVIASKSTSNLSAQSRVQQILQREQWTWSDNANIFELQSRILTVESKVRESLSALDTKVLGIGASISTSYLINQFSLSEFISHLVDDDISKVGKFSPYYGLEVISFSNHLIQQCDTALILAWQHTNVLLNRLRTVGFKGRVLVPLPDIKWIEL